MPVPEFTAINMLAPGAGLADLPAATRHERAVVDMGVIAGCGAAGAWLKLRSAATPVDPVVVDAVAD